MIWGLIFLTIGIMGLLGTERLRRSPQLIDNGFMVRYTHSIVLMLYTNGQTKAEIRRLLAEDENLRRKYILENYGWSALLLVCGVVLMITN